MTPSVARYHPRVEATLLVSILDNGRKLAAKAKNLSMAGLCLLGAPPTADELTVALKLPGGDREVITRARVKRRAPDKTALEFDQLDWDDLMALARYLSPRF